MSPSLTILPFGVIGNTPDFGSGIGESYSSGATNSKCSLNNISWGSLMVRCQAHNLETVIASVSSILTPATSKETYSKFGLFILIYGFRKKINVS